MRSLLNFTINILLFLLFVTNIKGEYRQYYLESKLPFQKGSKIVYTYNYMVKEYDKDKQQFIEADRCDSCDKPDFMSKAPEEEWFLTLKRKISIKNDKKYEESFNKLKQLFEIKKIKRATIKKHEFIFFKILKIKDLKKEEEVKIEGITILQDGDTKSKYVFIPPNDDFVKLYVYSIDSKGKKYKNKDIKLSSSCGKLKVLDYNSFKFTFFPSEKKCSIYAKLGAFIQKIDVIKLNKDGTNPFELEILYKDKAIDEIVIPFNKLKKGIKLKIISKSVIKKPFWSSKNGEIKFQNIEDGILCFPNVKKNEYQIFFEDKKTGLSDQLKIRVK